MEQQKGQHLTADGREITAGGWYWDNNLQLVQVTQVAAHANSYPLSDGRTDTQTWHKHTRGHSDSMQYRYDIGRLARFHPVTRQDAQEAAVQQGLAPAGEPDAITVGVTVHEGYLIIAAVPSQYAQDGDVSQLVVTGHRRGAVQPYVTWEYNGPGNYYWGRHFSRPDVALADMTARALGGTTAGVLEATS